MIYFTSDYHIGHKNIIKSCGRPFENITEHDNGIIRRHNEKISDSDEVIDLGDIGYRCSAWHLFNCLKQMNGKRTVLLGNHDKPFRQAYKKGMFNDLLKSGKLEVIGGETSIHDHSLYIQKMWDIEGQRVFTGHLACRSWPTSFRGAIHVHGHSHANLPELPHTKCYDVGVDAWDYYPVSFQSIMKKSKAMDDGIELSHSRPSGFEDGTDLYRDSVKQFNKQFV